MKTWICLLGMDLEHIEFTEAVNSDLETYYEIEASYDHQGENYDFLDSN